MSIRQFQQEHGEQWSAIIESPAFAAAMQYLNVQKISDIARLTDEEIKERGVQILADLRGHLNHEENLIKLSVLKDLEFGAPPAETYPDPQEEAAQAAAAEAGKHPNISAASDFHPPKPRKRKK